jgi:hypothetical protein
MRQMRNLVLVESMVAVSGVASAMVWSKQNKMEIVGLRPGEVKWSSGASVTGVDGTA